MPIVRGLDYICSLMFVWPSPSLCHMPRAIIPLSPSSSPVWGPALAKAKTMTERSVPGAGRAQPQPLGRVAMRPSNVDFPIVALGASAGGLEAFKKFFDAMPEKCGMAFVLIQHLDPKHQSLMADLLHR